MFLEPEATDRLYGQLSGRIIKGNKSQGQYNVRACKRLPEKSKFFGIDCDEIPVPFSVLLGYRVVQNLRFVMVLARVVQIAVIATAFYIEYYR